MNHEEAIATKALAGYLLCDLSKEDREAFEVHMFGCTQCAEEVQYFSYLQGGTEGDPTLDPRFYTRHAVAAYVLGDLTETDRETFETHMHDCRVCFALVSMGVKILADFHRVLDGEIAPGTRRAQALRFSRWFQLVFERLV